jgi:hypothetical protein
MSFVLSELTRVLIWRMLRLGSGGWMLEAGSSNSQGNAKVAQENQRKR